MMKNFTWFSSILLLFITSGCLKSSVCTQKASIELDNIQEDSSYFFQHRNFSNLNYNLFTPRFFTPNGDGKNDAFIPEVLISLDAYTITIKNECRKVFEATDINTHWDGKHNNKEVREGEYQYTITVQWDSINQSAFKGTFSLLR